MKSPSQSTISLFVFVLKSPPEIIKIECKILSNRFALLLNKMCLTLIEAYRAPHSHVFTHSFLDLPGL